MNEQEYIEELNNLESEIEKLNKKRAELCASYLHDQLISTIGDVLGHLCRDREYSNIYRIYFDVIEPGSYSDAKFDLLGISLTVKDDGVLIKKCHKLCSVRNEFVSDNLICNLYDENNTSLELREILGVIFVLHDKVGRL